MASFVFAGRELEKAAVDDIVAVFQERTGSRPEVYEDGDTVLVSSRPGLDQGDVKVAFNGYIVGDDTVPEERIAREYREKGPGFVENIDGQFRYIIYDTGKDRFHASADKAGRKVLYWSDTGSFSCSSHLAPMLRLPGIRAEPDPEGVSQFLQGWSASFGGGHRLLDGVSRVYPSHHLTYSDGRVSEQMFWDTGRDKIQVSDSEAAERLDELMTQGAERLVEQVDGPLQVFLSGGFDSTFLVSLLRDVTDRKIDTYTWGWEDGHFQSARAMAERYGTDHTEIRNSYELPSLDEVWYYEEPQTAFLRYPFRELYHQHGLRHYWTGLNSQATFPVCLKNIRKLDRASFTAPFLRAVPTRRLKDAVARFDYQAAKGLEALESDSRSVAAAIDWSIRKEDADRLLAHELQGYDLVEHLDRNWNPPGESYQENYSYLQLRARDTARYAYYSQDMEHYDVYGYTPLLEYSYSLPMSQKKNRRLLQRIARGRVPDHVITKGASGWEFVSQQFRRTIERNRSDYEDRINGFVDRGFVDVDAARELLLQQELPRDKGRINQMVAVYLLEEWFRAFIDREEPWRPPA